MTVSSPILLFLTANLTCPESQNFIRAKISNFLHPCSEENEEIRLELMETCINRLDISVIRCLDDLTFLELTKYHGGVN